MDTNLAVSILGVIVAAVGVLFVVLTLFEYTRLRKLRQQMEGLRKETIAEVYRIQQASHRVIASYHAQSLEQRVTLLQSAASIHPDAFNVHNALGYAYHEQGRHQQAIDAFGEAIRRHPDDKAGYFDLAWAHLQGGEADRGLALKYLEQAIKVDPTAVNDLRCDNRFETLASDQRFKQMVRH